MKADRRSFLKHSLLLAGTAALGSSTLGRLVAAPERQPFMISLAEASLRKALQTNQVNHFDFPRIATTQYGIQAIELANEFFDDKVRDRQYLLDYKRRCDDFGVRVLLVRVSEEGALGHPDANERKKAVENHCRWVEAAKLLNCHSIRVHVDTAGGGSPADQMGNAVQGLRSLVDYAGKLGMNILVENRGGLSADASWLASLVKGVGLANCGTVPDFGSFRISEGREYDRYQGVREMMPFARAVSAKTLEFDAGGNEMHTDYRRMLKIVVSAGYRGYVGITYEGASLSEKDGILTSKRLLETVRTELTTSA
jgi:L-ribulose-5-phosphate 3-epimerase